SFATFRWRCCWLTRRNFTDRARRPSRRWLPRGAFGAVRSVHQIADYLTDPLVVKQDGDPSRSDVNGHAVPHHQRIGMIHLEPIPIHQRDRERSVRSSPLESPQGVIEMVCLHRLTSAVVPECLTKYDSITTPTSRATFLDSRQNSSYLMTHFSKMMLPSSPLH